MSNLDSAQSLKAKFGDLISGPAEFRGEITLHIADAERMAEVCAFAKNDLGFDYLVDLSSLDHSVRKKKSKNRKIEVIITCATSIITYYHQLQ